MTAGPVKCLVLFPLQDAVHYPEPRKVRRLEKMPLRCCRFQGHELFYSSVRAYFSSLPIMKKENTYLDGVDYADTRTPSAGWCPWVTKLFDWELKDCIVHCPLL
jgi:hypothetical protein